MILTGEMAVILRYSTEFSSFRGQLITSKWLKVNPYCLRQKCSRRNPGFSNIWLMAIFSGVS